MEITFNTPALLFPDISLLLLAYTNRFLALASRVRDLHARYLKSENQSMIHGQIKNLRFRIRLIKNMQAFGVLSFLFCVVCMFTIFSGWTDASFIVFGISISCFIISLVTSLVEITLSMRALEIELRDIEELSKSNFFKDMIGKE